ncbi:MAG: hypothetical protein H7Y04_11570 [Verrucomicrobia bacterium]|nr:hypothetical protein [Cytophagales bacterium]
MPHKTKDSLEIDSLPVITIPQKPPLDKKKQVILLTGDSMSEGLMFPFIKYARYNNHQLHTVIWYSSSTKLWAEKDSLQKLIAKYKPTFVIFTLGSNELFIRNIRQEREEYVKDIIGQAGNTKFIWVGPPNWREDTGINDMLAENLEADRFFISKNMKFERANDGRHPSRRASVMWADSIATWLMKDCRYPFVFEKPTLPQQTIIGNWQQQHTNFLNITKDSVFFASDNKSYKYFFNGNVISLMRGKQNYRANVRYLSKDSLVLQDYQGTVNLSKHP